VWQGWTGERANDDLAVVDERQRHRVLIAAQKATRAIEWVESPEARPALPLPAIDPRSDLGWGSWLLTRDGTRQLLHQCVVCVATEIGAALFRDDRITRELLREHAANDRLCGEIGDGDR
jgi:hypothetical protein